MPTLFVGVGPARDVSEEELRARIEEFAPVQGIRMRGQCAFVDIGSADDAQRVMYKLDGVTINSSRLSVQWSKERRNAGGPPRGGDMPPQGRGSYGEGFGGGDRRRYREPDYPQRERYGAMDDRPPYGGGDRYGPNVPPRPRDGGGGYPPPAADGPPPMERGWHDDERRFDPQARRHSPQRYGESGPQGRYMHGGGGGRPPSPPRGGGPSSYDTPPHHGPPSHEQPSHDRRGGPPYGGSSSFRGAPPDQGPPPRSRGDNGSGGSAPPPPRSDRSYQPDGNY